jgi:tetrahydromethanopterin S-methyltransferase subunit D
MEERMSQRPDVCPGERGHALLAVGGVIGAIGAVLLAIGITNDTNALVWIGAIAMAVGPVAIGAINHMTVEYDIFGRLEKLEK